MSLRDESFDPVGFSIATASAGELGELLALLKDSNLPVDGVAKHLDGFLVARDGRALLGVVGLERYGNVGLLRSLAVRPRARGRGLGTKLVDALLDEARQRHVSILYLLTETAEDFFPRFGFERIPRESLDKRLEASRELQGVCPETAVAMRLEL